MAIRGYKKYMKKNTGDSNSLIKIFALAFCGTLLLVTFLIKTFSPTADTSIGDYKDPRDFDTPEETKKIVDNRLEMIQDEDQGRSFSEIMDNALKQQKEINETSDIIIDTHTEQQTQQEQVQVTAPTVQEHPKPAEKEAVYRVYVGSYTSADLAKVAKEIIQESGNGLNPIVKCIGANNYTLQVGIFKNKKSAEAMLTTVEQNHLPGRIVKDY